MNWYVSGCSRPVSSEKTRNVPPSFAAMSTRTTSSAPLNEIARSGAYSFNASARMSRGCRLRICRGCRRNGSRIECHPSRIPRTRPLQRSFPVRAICSATCSARLRDYSTEVRRSAGSRRCSTTCSRRSALSKFAPDLGTGIRLLVPSPPAHRSAAVSVAITSDAASAKNCTGMRSTVSPGRW